MLKNLKTLKKPQNFCKEERKKKMFADGSI